jgi:hypothetical protein
MHDPVFGWLPLPKDLMPEPPFDPKPKPAMFDWHDETQPDAWPSMVERHVQEAVRRQTMRCEAFLECVLKLSPEHVELIRTYPGAIPLLLQGQSLYIVAGSGHGKAHRAILWRDILERMTTIPATEVEIHKAAHYFEMLQDEAGRALVEDILKRKHASIEREERRNGEH